MENKEQRNEYRIWNIEYWIQFFSNFKFDFQNSTFNIQHSPRNRGISLLELLIYIALLAGLMVVVSDAFISLSKGRGQSQARSEINSALRFSVEKIRQDLKGATAVSSPLLGTASSSLTMTAGGATVTYDVILGVLRRTENTVVATTTASSVFVDPPIFTRLENYNTILNATTTTIQMLLTMRYGGSSTDWMYSESLRTTVTIR